MNEPSSSLSPEDQHFTDFVQLWNQITDKHVVDALMKFAAEEAATSLPLSDKRILSHPPMELTDEEKRRFAAMWDNVPTENTITLSPEESKAFTEKLNSPPTPNDRLIKLMMEKSMLEKSKISEALKCRRERLQSTDTYKSDTTDDRGST